MLQFYCSLILENQLKGALNYLLLMMLITAFVISLVNMYSTKILADHLDSVYTNIESLQIKDKIIVDEITKLRKKNEHQKL